MSTNSKQNTQSVQVLKQTELCGRQFTVYGTAEQPLFRANEVAEIIEHSHVSKMLALVDDDEKGVNQLFTPGGNQQVWFLTEDGLYEVLMQSRKPIAKQFKKGVKQILHDVRTTGGYLATKSDDTPEEIMARALTIAQATLIKREERLKELEQQTERQQVTIDAQATELKAAAPKVRYVDEVLQSVNTYTSTQIAKEIGMDAAKFHKALKERKVMFYQSGTWMLTAKYQGKGYTKMRTHQFTRNDGSVGTNSYTVFTEKGRAMIHNIFGGNPSDGKITRII